MGPTLWSHSVADKVPSRLGRSRRALGVGGALANMQTQLENHLQPIQDKILELDKLEGRVNALERGDI
jgi:hypothetical protein